MFAFSFVVKVQLSILTFSYHRCNWKILIETNDDFLTVHYWWFNKKYMQTNQNGQNLLFAIVNIWLTASSMLSHIFVIQLCRMPPVPSRPGIRSQSVPRLSTVQGIKENGLGHGTECPVSVNPEFKSAQSLVKIIKWLKNKEIIILLIVIYYIVLFISALQVIKFLSDEASDIRHSSVVAFDPYHNYF